MGLCRSPHDGGGLSGAAGGGRPAWAWRAGMEALQSERWTRAVPCESGNGSCPMPQADQSVPPILQPRFAERSSAAATVLRPQPLVRELAAGPGADGAVAATVGADCGRLWPRPTQLEMAEGDAVLVHWATPHAAVRPLPCSWSPNGRCHRPVHRRHHRHKHKLQHLHDRFLMCPLGAGSLSGCAVATR